jgi:hypothetical protein
LHRDVAKGFSNGSVTATANQLTRERSFSKDAPAPMPNFPAIFLRSTSRAVLDPLTPLEGLYIKYKPIAAMIAKINQ